MSGALASKTSILCILDILRKHSDADHRLTQKDVIRLMAEEYGVKIERKAVSRNLTNLRELGYDIESAGRTRTIDDDEEGIEILTDFYLVPDFDPTQVRILIDTVISSRIVTEKQARELVEKLKGLASKHFAFPTRNIGMMGSEELRNDQMFYTIQVLDEGISKGKKVRFYYMSFGTDKKQHRRKKNGVERLYTVSPYYMVAWNGRYYLICSSEGHFDITYYRLDRIRDILLTDEPIVPKEEIKGLEHGLDLPKHLKEHVSMYIGESTYVDFRFDKKLLDVVLDTFGSDVRFTDEDAESVVGHILVNGDAMKAWALQYPGRVRVLAPESLVTDIRKALATGLAAYE